MFEAEWGEVVEAWPVGVDTEQWRPSDPNQKTIDVLLYDKVMWNHDHYEKTLIEPMRIWLRQGGCSVGEIRYGRFGLVSDFLYVKLSDDAKTPFGVLADKLDVTLIHRRFEPVSPSIFDSEDRRARRCERPQTGRKQRS